LRALQRPLKYSSIGSWVPRINQLDRIIHAF
jgi:hypothetical protein